MYSFSVNCVFVTTKTGHVACVNFLLQAGAVIIMCDGFSQHALLYSVRTLTAVLSCITIHLGADAYKFSHNFASKLVFKFADDFLVLVGVERVAGRVVAGVVEVCVLHHVGIDVVGFNVNDH